MSIKSTILVQPPSDTSPGQTWTPSPVLHVRFTVPFWDRSTITARASIVSWNGTQVAAIPSGMAVGPFFGVPKTPPPIYAPAEWDAYFCWEGLSCAEPGTYRLRVEVEVPGLGRDVAESRFVLVWRGLGSDLMTSPSADELRTLHRLEQEVGKGPFRTVTYKRTGGPAWWLG